MSTERPPAQEMAEQYITETLQRMNPDTLTYVAGNLRNFARMVDETLTAQLAEADLKLSMCGPAEAEFHQATASLTEIGRAHV